MHAQILATRERVLGSIHPDVADEPDESSPWLRARAEIKPRQRRHMERALDIVRAAFGEQHPKVADVLNNLATHL